MSVYSHDSRSWGSEQCAQPLHPLIQRSINLVQVLGMPVDGWMLSVQITSWTPQYLHLFDCGKDAFMVYVFIYFFYFYILFIYLLFIYRSPSLSSTKVTLKRVPLKRNEGQPAHLVKEYLLPPEKKNFFIEGTAPPGEPRQEKGKEIE